MCPYVSYTPCATYLREQTGNIFMLAQFWERKLLTKTINNAESGDGSHEISNMPPLLSKEEMDAMDYGDESDHDLISTDMLENICDGSQSHPKVNKIEALVIKYVIILIKDNRNGNER